MKKLKNIHPLKEIIVQCVKNRDLRSDLPSRILTHHRKSTMKGNMKKLKNIHPLKEIVVHGQCITIGFMLTISHIGAANPLSFVSADIPLPRPQILRQGKYHGKFTPKKGKR